MAVRGDRRYDCHVTESRSDSTPRQRWQLLFSRTHPALRMRQAELVDELERAFREEGLPLSYTRATRPRPRIKLAANLPVGLELRGEVVEVHFDDLVTMERVRAAAERFPEGVELRDAKEVWHGFPSAASQLRAAEYEIRVTTDDQLTLDDLRGAIVRLLAAKELPGLRRRGESERRTDAGDRDLRPLIEDVEIIGFDPEERSATLRTVLRLDATGAGRPEDVVHALDVPLGISGAARTRLLFVDTPPIAR